MVQRIKANASTFVECFRQLQKNLSGGRHLLNADLRISLCYCDSLFESGVLNRLESKRIKNGLQTIKKRSDFDKNYFDSADATSIYESVDRKLVQLVGEIGLKIQLGRSLRDRNLTALRVWLKEEILHISGFLRTTQKIFLEFGEKNRQTVIFCTSSGRKDAPVLFPHWCLKYFEIFQGDRERLDEVWRRVNTMPLGSNDGTGTIFEFDREALASQLGFQRITTNSLEAICNQDFIAEFVNASTLAAAHILSYLTELSKLAGTGVFYFEEEIEISDINYIIVKLKKIFTLQSGINMNLQTETDDTVYTDAAETLFITVDLLKKFLTALNLLLRNVRLDQPKILEMIKSYVPDVSEITFYLVQRIDSVEEAQRKASLINQTWRNKGEISLTRVEAITNIKSQDFFDEVSLIKTIERKNQIGGTAGERVAEALEEARKVLLYDE